MANKSFIFEDKIYTPKIKKLIKEIQEEELKDDDNITLYFSSTGGYLHSLDILIDFLKSLPNPIKIVANRCAYSCGFLFLMEMKNKATIEIKESCHGMVHKAEVADDEDGSFIVRQVSSLLLKILPKTSYYKHMTSVIADTNRKIGERIKELGLTQKELNKFKKNEDVYFKYDRMKEIFERSFPWD